MSLDASSRARFNLGAASILLVEKNNLDMEVLSQILVGFGGRQFTKCANIEEAKSVVGHAEFDLMLVAATLGDEDGLALVEWIRRFAPKPNRFAPLMVIAAHTQGSRVTDTRDCGAHFLVAKPLTPNVLLERILWILREKRAFVTSDGYAGPDRRFKLEGPPKGMAGRRQDDLPEELGQAVEANMSQDQIDAMMAPRKLSL